MKKRLAKTCMMLSLASAVLATGIGTAWSDPPPHAPAHGYRAKQAKTYKYYYYPAQQVYYRPNYGYYYMNNNAWQYSATLPTRINLGNRVSIDLPTAIPYSQHPTVVQQYPVIVVP